MLHSSSHSNCSVATGVRTGQKLKRNVILTGPPGIGKTTLIKKIIEELNKEDGTKCRGFYTEEVRQDNSGYRTGFDIITIDGKREILARESPPLDRFKQPKVGKYFVNVSNFEKVVLPLMSGGVKTGCQPFIIDEIGKMELMSKRFEEAVRNILGKTILIATIPSRTSQLIEIIEHLKSSRNSIVFEISKQNRNIIFSEIISKIGELINE